MYRNRSWDTKLLMQHPKRCYRKPVSLLVKKILYLAIRLLINGLKHISKNLRYYTFDRSDHEKIGKILSRRFSSAKLVLQILKPTNSSMIHQVKSVLNDTPTAYTEFNSSLTKNGTEKLEVQNPIFFW